jgi:hypothetical protein
MVSRPGFKNPSACDGVRGGLYLRASSRLESPILLSEKTVTLVAERRKPSGELRENALISVGLSYYRKKDAL